jgi:hypothetical protein
MPPLVGGMFHSKLKADSHLSAFSYSLMPPLKLIKLCKSLSCGMYHSKLKANYGWAAVPGYMIDQSGHQSGHRKMRVCHLLAPLVERMRISNAYAAQDPFKET